jgi:thiamine-phosphate pyrophosphorylase
MTSEPKRCRIVLIAPEGLSAERFGARLRQAVEGGDVASLMLPANGMDDQSFQHFCEHVVPIAHEAGVAVVIERDTQIAGRVHADGIHLETGAAAIGDEIERLQQRLMVGVGGVKTRDDALELGELRPDYIFFGRFGYDTKPEPHHRNLTLGTWWAEVIEIPCIVMGGSAIESVVEVAQTGAEFVALSAAVFGDEIDPRSAIVRANALLDEHAPRFEA